MIKLTKRFVRLGVPFLKGAEYMKKALINGLAAGYVFVLVSSLYNFIENNTFHIGDLGLSNSVAWFIFVFILTTITGKKSK